VSPAGAVLNLEVKHKYPMKSLAFGMNVGEGKIAQMLAGTGFLTWHVVLVKPRWNPKQSSMYLFFDREARERALWIAADMSAAGFFSGQAETAAGKTSLYGGGGVQFEQLDLKEFRLLGSNAQASRMIGRQAREGAYC